jgi:hypothetical protein
MTDPRPDPHPEPRTPEEVVIRNYFDQWIRNSGAEKWSSLPPWFDVFNAGWVASRDYHEAQERIAPTPVRETYSDCFTDGRPKP